MNFVEDDTIKDFDLDSYIKNNENRKPNRVGLYRVNCLVIGKTGSGKTTTLIKWLLSNNMETFGLIICIIPRESMDSGIYSRLSGKDPRFVFCVIGEDKLPSISDINEISNSIKQPIALVLDDFITVFNKENWKQFERYITQLSRVSHGCSLFALSQNLQFIKPVWKKNFNCFCIFVNSFTYRQFNDFMTSYYDGFSFSKHQLKDIYDTLKQDIHTPLWLFNNGSDRSILYGNVWIMLE